MDLAEIMRDGRANLQLIIHRAHYCEHFSENLGFTYLVCITFFIGEIFKRIIYTHGTIHITIVDLECSTTAVRGHVHVWAWGLTAALCRAALCIKMGPLPSPLSTLYRSAQLLCLFLVHLKLKPSDSRLHTTHTQGGWKFFS